MSLLRNSCSEELSVKFNERLKGKGTGSKGDPWHPEGTRTENTLLGGTWFADSTFVGMEGHKGPRFLPTPAVVRACPFGRCVLECFSM